MKWNINNKFSYPKSTRSLYNGSRHYLIAGERLPSVTNIISMTKKNEEKEALDRMADDISEMVSIRTRFEIFSNTLRAMCGVSGFVK